MLEKKLSDDARYAIIIVISLLTIPLMFYLFDRFAGSRQDKPQENRPMTVIVTEAAKKEMLEKIDPKSVVDTVREAMKQGNSSTAYLQLNRLPRDSKEYQELAALLAEEAKKHPSRPGVRKESSSSGGTIRYFDESTPRDRSSDALYLYLVDASGGIWPRFCIQTIGTRPLAVTEFRVKADGKTLVLHPSGIRTETINSTISEYYDAPLDERSYPLVKAIVTARTARLVCAGSGGERERTITDAEKNGLRRMLETYAALGGRLFPLPASDENRKPGPASRHRTTR
jgi:hypothetical protein